MIPLIFNIEKADHAAQKDPEFQNEFNYYAKHYIGRPSSLYHAARLSDHLGGFKIYGINYLTKPTEFIPKIYPLSEIISLCATSH